jgi:hypothetical protein
LAAPTRSSLPRRDSRKRCAAATSTGIGSRARSRASRSCGPRWQSRARSPLGCRFAEMAWAVA